VDDGQVAVEHEDVVVVHREPLQRGVAVVRHVDSHRLPPQADSDRVGEQPFVLDDEHPHPAHLLFVGPPAVRSRAALHRDAAGRRRCLIVPRPAVRNV
jgi:hypothetical protein